MKKKFDLAQGQYPTSGDFGKNIKNWVISPIVLILSILAMLFGSAGNSFASPVINISASTTTICEGAPITFTGTISGATNMTTFQWKDNGIAMSGTGNSGSIAFPGNGTFTFTIAGLANGDVITCFITEPSVSFSTLSSGINITVNTTPATIGGPDTASPGGMVILTNSVSGGLWTSSNPSIARACSTCGHVTGVSVGTCHITYNLGGCAVNTPFYVVPIAPITGNSNVCTGSTITLTDANAGGTWISSNPSIATVNSVTGVVTGISAGTVNIDYQVFGGAVTTPITVNIPPAAISGTTTIGLRGTTTLSNTTSYGAWSSSQTLVATIGSGTGYVTAINPGTSIISYTVNGCNATTVVNILPIYAITGSVNLCVGATSYINDVSSGGAWTSSNPAVVTVNSTTGFETGVSAGTSLLSYTLGGSILSTVVTVTAIPTTGAISGLTRVLVGDVIVLSDFNSGGLVNWSSSNPGVATVSSAGLVSGIASGAAIITYAVSNGCGTGSAYSTISVLASSCSPVIISVAGNGALGYSGDGGMATAGQLNDPYSVAVDNSGNIYIADRSNYCIRKVNTAGIITTFAGNGTSGYTGDNGPANAAQLNLPTGVACDALGNVYIADQHNNCIRKVDVSGVITTFAGNGLQGYSGDGGAATAAELNWPVNVATDASGNLFIVDFSNSAIRKVSPSGIITTVAGTGMYGFSGDGGPATLAQLYHPTMIACDAIGNLYIDDENNDRIRKVDISGVINTIAGNGIDGYSGDGGPATDAQLNEAWGVCVDRAGNVYIADQVNERIRIVNPLGIISTYCGTGVRGALGDGGPATGSQLYYPYGICMDTSGNMYITDNINERIRKIVPGCITGIVGATALCNGASMTLTDSISGGSWSSSNTSIATINPGTGVVTGVAAGTALITYTLGSSEILSLTVMPSPTVSGTVTNVTCNGFANGNISVTASGGSASGTWLYYTYLWNTGATTTGAYGLTAGVYTVTATDPNGCSGTTAFTVAQPAPITDSAIMADTLSGCGAGKIVLMVAGGTSPYTFTWSDGETTQNISGLAEGAYWVTITDSNSCQTTGWYYVNPCTGCEENGERRSNVEAVTTIYKNDISVKAYPNPFSTRATITFSTPASGHAVVEIRNAITGEKLETIFDDYTTGGKENTCFLNADNLSAGIYIYQISSGASVYTGKLILVR